MKNNKQIYIKNGRIKKYIYSIYIFLFFFSAVLFYIYKVEIIIIMVKKALTVLMNMKRRSNYE